MLPASARSTAQILPFAPPPAAPAAGLAAPCYIPKRGVIRQYGVELLLRRIAWSLIELACIGIAMVAIAIWTALGAGA